MAVSNPLVGSVPLYAGLGFTESTPSVTHPEYYVKVPAYRSGISTGPLLTTASQASPSNRDNKKKKKNTMAYRQRRRRTSSLSDG
ncbi:unnamed protein product [Fusarium graminearum]|uniref:Uncharacterized protein n=1 Tax=Gibberella zeae TaxID=5518 RepID=A0A4U9F3Q1_GIBZA|nr:unnamed protein product [Fusarium graminearum]CAF3539083.1 unnamed protein product [Fusarium graminearum]CAF3631345.1 unnamed protein product [Fusarium graminearum]CAG1984706.1 unnamed protein product [Fusarium graminearum]CAG1993564.1 unnamed protein product [Fusarium graminearum]